MSQYPKSPLMGQMMDQPLLISSIIQHADRHFGSNEIVSHRVEGDIRRYTYRDCHCRARQLANVLAALGGRHGRAGRDAGLERLSAYGSLIAVSG